jgi:hypothetical protein
MRSAAYDTERVEPLANGIGRFTFQIEVKHARSRRRAKSSGRGNVRGKNRTSPAAPARTTAAT